jgi:hypothetical protein
LVTYRQVDILTKKLKYSCFLFQDYLGFSVPDDFIIGYAIDYNDQFRDLEVRIYELIKDNSKKSILLKHICAISDSAIEKYKKKK